jgi:hypothetical protein
MGLTNAEKQARWRAKRDAEIKRLRKAAGAPSSDSQELIDARNEIERLRNENAALKAEREAARRKAVEDAEPEIDARTLSLSAQKKIELAVKQQAQKIAAEYQRRFADEIKQRLEDTVLPHYREMEKRYRDLSESRTKGVMDKKTFRLIWSCLHTDSRKSVSDERLNEAFHQFSRMETKLMSEADHPTPKFKMPTTYEEMMALKQKVSAERKAKRAQQNVVRR